MKLWWEQTGIKLKEQLNCNGADERLKGKFHSCGWQIKKSLLWPLISAKTKDVGRMKLSWFLIVSHACFFSSILQISLNLSVLANSRSQFLLDRLGRCLKLFVSTESISCHEFASQFGLPIFFVREKHPKLPRIPSRPRQCLFEWSSDLPLFAGHGRSIASNNKGAYMSGDNSDQIGPRLSQNGEMQQVKTATTRDYTFTAWKIWFRNYYVAYAFV